MSTDISLPFKDLKVLEPNPHDDSEDRFAERRRIALMENDRVLRAVIVRNLLRVGCIVTFKRSHAEVICALREGRLHGVIVALEADDQQIAAIHEANVNSIPIVVLTNAAPAPHQSAAYPSLRFLQKPFDMRELFTHLNLPHTPKILRAG